MGANVSSTFPDRVTSPRPSRPPSYLMPASSDHTDHGNHRDKKKKMHKLATLRKKLIRARRHSRSLDYTKVVRELTAGWTIKELNALVEEYESSAAMKDVAMAASLARPHANSYKEDLSALYDFKYCTDVDLVYQDVVFPVHRAILSVRCPRFRDLLARYPDYGTQVPVHIRTAGVDVNMFSALLRYLYTGEFSAEEYKGNMNVLVRLGEEFGPLNPLEHDLRTLLETGAHCDAVLTFSCDMVPTAPPATAPAAMDAHEAGIAAAAKHKHELRCHKAILAARSPFFRNLLLRRARSGEELTERALHSPSRIVLDDSVIPRRYARVLLTVLYTDVVDLTCIVRSSVSMCSLSEVQAMVAGRGHMTLTDEAMEIHQIGQFLDLPVLSQGCEDVMVDSLSPDKLPATLAWSREAHGSPWVHRQALHYLREEFLQLANSPVLYDLSREYLLHAVQSDFLQAGELDVLSAILRWGEHQLIRRMEEREPNLLSHTAHSVSKKGVKKRDLSDLELREVLSDLLPHVRTDHVIPTNHDVLTGAIKRGLISRPPSHMLADETAHSLASAWVRVRNTGLFVKPRLFSPYHEEAKSLLEEQLSQVQENEVVRLRMVQMSNIPDMVQYMVEERGYPGHRHPPVHPQGPPPASSAPATVDILAATIPVPNPDMLGAMLKREAELLRSKAAERAHSLPYTSSRQLTHHIQLQVVREFGLPDSMTEVLHSSPRSASQEQEEELLAEARYHTPRRATKLSLGSALPPPPAPAGCFPPRRAHHHHHHHYTTVPCHHQILRHVQHSSPCLHRQPHRVTTLPTHHHDDRRCPSTPVSPVRGYGTLQLPAPCAEGPPPSGACGTMPDIAMATSAMNQLTLQHPQHEQQQRHPGDLDLAQPDLELDLGDGSSHSHSNPGTLYI